MSQYIVYSSRTSSGGGGSGVTSLNGQTGALTLVAGSNITITPGTGTLTIDATAGGTVTAVTASAPLASSGGATPDISIQLADSTHDGYLSSTDWNTFNNKQAALTLGNLTDVGTDGITITGGAGSVIGSGVSISQHVADSTHNGYLSSTDWNTFNSKQPSGSYITALTGDVSASGPGSAAATVNSVGGSSAASIHSAELLANAATPLIIADTIVKRDSSGDFATHNINLSSLIPGRVPFQGGFGFSSSVNFTWDDTIQQLVLGLSSGATGFKLGVYGANTNAFAGGMYAESVGIVNTDGFYSNAAAAFSVVPRIASGVTESGSHVAIEADAFRYGDPLDAGSLANLIGIAVYPGHTGGSTFTTTNVMGLTIQPYADSGTITNLYDIYVQPGTLTGATVSNQFGLYISANDVGVKNNFLSGNTRFGSSYATPAAAVDIAGSIKIVDGTEGAGKILTSDATGLATWSSPGAGSAPYYVDTFTLTGTDITNGYVTLTGSPTVPASTALTVIGGPMQDYGADFTVTGSQLSWTGLFLDGVLVAGDKLVVQFN